jgi:hypothetical protein
VGDDWLLPDSLAARLAAADSGATGTPGLRARGYLAGAAVAAAIEGGALSREEIAAALTARTRSDPYLRARGFLDARSLGARLPVYTVRRGRAVESP